MGEWVIAGLLLHSDVIRCLGWRCGLVDVDGGGFDYEFLRRDWLSYGVASPCDFALISL